MNNQIDEVRFALPGITLHGARTGTGPLVLYLHGITANWAVWAPVMQGLADISTGISISQRGHGHSGRPTTGYRGDDFASDVVALVERVDLGPAVIVGHSLGARNAVLAGQRRPDLISGILSVDFVPNTGRNELQTLADRVSGGDREFSSIDEVREYLQARYRKMPADAVDRRARHGYIETGAGTLRPLADGAAMRQTAAGLFEPYPDEYRELAVPMVALRGAESTLVSQAAFDDAAKIRPDVEHTVIADADHYIPEEQPDVIIGYTRTLLRQTAHQPT